MSGSWSGFDVGIPSFCHLQYGKHGIQGRLPSRSTPSCPQLHKVASPTFQLGLSEYSSARPKLISSARHESVSVLGVEYPRSASILVIRVRRLLYMGSRSLSSSRGGD